ncbi:uncharacterized protein LOC126687935 [Mercurialis annua]|uniref:uncharacterized protein LOC126687935 n=1 Tax=Mercurialis annua TaxID=3986 RepID=UPI00215EBE11|nr:uncharacterized protein LOC126687935 [Mercurialis annua]
MSILSWNCRGLGNPRTVRVLMDLVQVHKPVLVFLMETMINEAKVYKVCQKIGFEGSCIVSGSGHGGGLALFWKHKNWVTILDSNRNFIDASIEIPLLPPWRFTGFYGFPERNRRQASWDLLRSLHRPMTIPWCCGGDFNDILRSNEKKGGAFQPSWLLDGFNSAVSDCNLTDIDMEGHLFTWERGRGTNHWIKERLDRFLVNPQWQLAFSQSHLKNVATTVSDHSALILKLKIWQKTQHPRRFRFENSWLRENDCSEVVNKSWHEVTTGSISVRI